MKIICKFDWKYVGTGQLDLFSHPNAFCEELKV